MAAKKPKMRVGDLIRWTRDKRFKHPKDYVLEVLESPVERDNGTWWAVKCRVISLPEDFPKDSVIKDGDFFGCACFSVFGRADEVEFEGNI